MNNLASYFLANTYSFFSPTLNIAAAVCSVNGQQVACPQFLNILEPVSNILVPAILVVSLILMVIILAATWEIFIKAGQPGWASIIPIYNMVVMLKVVKKPTWWVILIFVPIGNFIIGLVVHYELAKVFGKGFGYTLGLIILPFIFYPMLASRNAIYNAGYSN